MTAARIVMVATIAAVLALGSVWQPFDPEAIDIAAALAPPGAEHWLGTDHLGRDILSRILVGGWRTLTVLAAVAAISFALGAMIGTSAALVGGGVAELLMRLAEFLAIMPSLVVALVITAIIGFTPATAGLALAIGHAGPFALMAYGLARRTVTEPYVEAARRLHIGRPRLVLRHILPNCWPTLAAYVAADLGRNVVGYAALAFLGLGGAISAPDWGSMLYEYRSHLFDSPGLMFWPGAAIAVTATVLNLALDPTVADTDDPV